MPVLARLGLAVLAIGALLDLTLHALGADAAVGHVLVFVGMLAVASAVAAQGLRAGNPAHPRSARSHAHR